MKIAIVNIGQLVTLGGAPIPRTRAAMRDLAIIEDAAVLCRDGVIEAVGRSAEMASEIEGAQIIDAGGSVVTPGLIDAHTHPIFAGARENEYEMRILGKTY